MTCIRVGVAGHGPIELTITAGSDGATAGGEREECEEDREAGMAVHGEPQSRDRAADTNVSELPRDRALGVTPI
jgi:hypothetical protein